MKIENKEILGMHKNRNLYFIPEFCKKCIWAMDSGYLQNICYCISNKWNNDPYSLKISGKKFAENNSCCNDIKKGADVCLEKREIKHSEHFLNIFKEKRFNISKEKRLKKEDILAIRLLINGFYDQCYRFFTSEVDVFGNLKEIIKFLKTYFIEFGFINTRGNYLNYDGMNKIRDCFKFDLLPIIDKRLEPQDLPKIFKLEYWKLYSRVKSLLHLLDAAKLDLGSSKSWQGTLV